MRRSVPSAVLGLAVLLGAEAAPAEIRVGVAAPLSGDVAWLGEQQEIGAQRAVADLNARGGLLGEEVVLIAVDDACDPEQAVAAARQLVEEGVHVVNGHMCSGATIAASKIYEDAGIVMISPGATSPVVTDDGGWNVFRVSGRDDQQGAVAGDYLAELRSEEKIAILHDGQEYGQRLAEETRRRLNERGVTEVLFQRFEPGSPDHSEIVEKLIGSGATVVYIGGYHNDSAQIIRRARESGAENLRLVSGDGLASTDFLLISGPAGEGAVFTFTPDARDNPEASDVVAAFRDEEAYDPAGFTLNSYAVIQAWSQAVERAGSTEGEAVADALRSGNFDTVLGEIGFDENGDVVGAENYIWYIYDSDGYAPMQ